MSEDFVPGVEAIFYVGAIWVARGLCLVAGLMAGRPDDHLIGIIGGILLLATAAFVTAAVFKLRLTNRSQAPSH